MKPGDHVKLASPNGKLVRGDPHALDAFLVVPNGATGVVVGAGGPTSVIVQWDAIGGTVGVSVRTDWLQDLAQ